jgi:very-short-patch-repair endonuclease
MTRVNTEPARRLRRNQTDAERLLWFRLRDRRLEGLKFKRQVPIERFVVDFFCADAKLIVELDGGHQPKIANVMRTEPESWKRWGTSCCDFGITT